MGPMKDRQPGSVATGLPCLQVEALSKRFAGLVALADVTLVVQQGERRAIIGPNGAGKTTLFNLISGELAPTAGRVVLDGRDITRLSANRRAHLGIARTFQITNLFPKLTVLENLVLAAQALERTKFQMLRPVRTFTRLYDRAEAILERMGLPDKRHDPVTNLSHGERRQIEVAMALLGEPHLLLLDEPAAGLAPAESALMVGMLNRLDRSISILIIEHDMDVAFEVADRITVLSSGRLLAEGTQAEVRANQTVQQIYLGVQ
jgi:branched-chain amino acid transport system ATP-binding protein